MSSDSTPLLTPTQRKLVGFRAGFAAVSAFSRAG